MFTFFTSIIQTYTKPVLVIRVFTWIWTSANSATNALQKSCQILGIDYTAIKKEYLLQMARQYLSGGIIPYFPYPNDKSIHQLASLSKCPFIKTS